MDCETLEKCAKNWRQNNGDVLGRQKCAACGLKCGANTRWTGRQGSTHKVLHEPWRGCERTLSLKQENNKNDRTACSVYNSPQGEKRRGKRPGRGYCTGPGKGPEKRK